MQYLFRISLLSSLLFWWPCAASAAALLNLRPNPLSGIQLISAPEQPDALLSATIPAGFEVVPRNLRGANIPELTCLGLALNVVSRLAVLNWEAHTVPASENLDGIKFATSVTAARRGTRGIQARYVIWGIYRAIQDLIRARDWRETVYELKWQGQIMGSLGIYKTTTTQAQAQTKQRLTTLPSSNEEGPANSLNQVRQDHFSSSSDSTPSSNDSSVQATTQPVPANRDLEIIISYPGDPDTPVLGPHSVYIVMLAMLILGARNPAAATITESYGLSVAGFNAQIAVTGPEQTRKPMTSPPFFTWRDVFTAVRATSGELVARRYFRSFKVRCLVEGVEVGNLRVEPRGGLPGGGVAVM
ncbi:MAG: hypothetical protein LQ349_009564 [Xanthoria aureola]|nr:MAG: hypothetical protein LQ349_009564 [Xanthoria aureola]